MTAPHYTRKKHGKIFEYFDGDTKLTDISLIARLDALAIPPAWRQVRIARSSKAKVQAQGIDKAGRVQTIYHPTFRLHQDQVKFERITRFARQLPALRRQLDKDLSRRRMSKERVLACIVRLIDEAYFRVGNERYAKENGSYGITTLRSKHTQITTSTITFDFIGKSGKRHVKKIKDPQLTRIIKRLDELPGHEIFRYQDETGTLHDIHSSDVNDYIKRHMGEEFTAKDFRTWGGTLLATSAILREEMDGETSKSARARTVSAVIKRVAKRLGNTPAIAKSSYIDPRVLVACEDGTSLPRLRRAMKSMRPKKYMSVDEQCVLALLQK